MDSLLKAAQVAEILNVRPTTVYALVDRGVCPEHFARFLIESDYVALRSTRLTDQIIAVDQEVLRISPGWVLAYKFLTDIYSPNDLA